MKISAIPLLWLLRGQVNLVQRRCSMRARERLGSKCGWASVLFPMALATSSCSNESKVGLSPDASVEPTATSKLVPRGSGEAARRLDALRARFVLTAVRQLGPSSPPQEVIGEGVVQTFEYLDDHRVRAVVPRPAKQGGARTASVVLPTAANNPVDLEDDVSHLAVKFSLKNASAAVLETPNGIALYLGAVAGADLIHRVHAEGTEDFVVFEKRPAVEELVYIVDVSRVAGLRLVSNTLEFLDEGGVPRLRVAPPYVVGATGSRHEAHMTVTGCAYDTNPRAPWDRGVTRAGAATCELRVTWHGVEYPALADPNWTSTGSMSAARYYHSASLLTSNRILIAGGSGLSTAELYDAATGTFSATGTMHSVRDSAAATRLATGTLLLTGGNNSTAETYDAASGMFSSPISMLASRYQHTATLLGSGKVLIVGGTDTSAAELFDPGTATFVPTGSASQARLLHTATLLLSGKVLLAGGHAYGGGNLSSAELYEPATGTFSTTGSMTSARWLHTATALVSGKIIVAGGGNVGSSLSTAESYDPGSGLFTSAGSMATPRTAHTATVIGSGKVLFAGGGTNGSGSITASAELFDPTTGMFATTGSMSTSRGVQTASLLTSGKVLIAGGQGGPSALIPDLLT
jgi:hypothetical protein